MVNNGWSVVSTYPSEKWWTSSVGMMTFPIYGKIKNVANHQPEWRCETEALYEFTSRKRTSSWMQDSPNLFQEAASAKPKNRSEMVRSSSSSPWIGRSNMIKSNMMELTITSFCKEARQLRVCSSTNSKRDGGFKSADRHTLPFSMYWVCFRDMCIWLYMT